MSKQIRTLGFGLILSGVCLHEVDMSVKSIYMVSIYFGINIFLAGYIWPFFEGLLFKSVKKINIKKIKKFIPGRKIDCQSTAASKRRPLSNHSVWLN